MPYLGRRGVFIPILVSLWYLIRLWREAELYGWKEILFPVWFVVALGASRACYCVGLEGSNRQHLLSPCADDAYLYWRFTNGSSLS